LVLTLLLAACSGKAAPSPGVLEEAAPSAEAPRVRESRVAILFGYGHNDPAYREPLVEELAALFGRADEGGLVLPLVFPGDFPYSRISLLFDRLAEEPVGVLLLLGAPERTHLVLARLQDAWEQSGRPYPVVSLFPQDDLLGTEAGSTLVFSHALSETPAHEEEEAEEKPGFTTPPELLHHMVAYWSAHLDNGAAGALSPAILAGELLGPDWVATPFTDSETSLRSANHFIIAPAREDGKQTPAAMGDAG
jgi:hypothetical protein